MSAMASEFDIIDRYFSRPSPRAVLGVGDDAALLAPGAIDGELAITADTFVQGTHFLADTEPLALGHKALAVNLSDLAAMGAKPRWVLLALTLPSVDEAWLAEFATGFWRLAERFEVELIGGDTTRGPLSVTITALGQVAAGKALRRDGARPGDEIWVSGELGDAALALAHRRGDLRLKGAELTRCQTRLDTPMPRVALGQKLVGVASSAIDVSDGLTADLGHIAARSSVRAEVDYEAVPCTAEVMALKGHAPVRQAMLAGGDDYELLFTAPAAAAGAIGALSGQTGTALTRIGRIVAGSGVAVRDAAGHPIETGAGGFDHFR
jgi:thiamine-monophosphate kinase